MIIDFIAKVLTSLKFDLFVFKPDVSEAFFHDLNLLWIPNFHVCKGISSFLERGI